MEDKSRTRRGGPECVSVSVAKTVLEEPKVGEYDIFLKSTEFTNRINTH